MTKRFMDAELAAEYWAPAFFNLLDVEETGVEESSAEVARRDAIIHRFATTPSFDAVQGD